MTPEPNDLIRFAVVVTGVMLALGVLLTFARLARGPTLADRVVALDLIALFAAGAIAVYSIATRQPILLLPAITLALVLFVGTVAFAVYVEKGTHDE